MQSRQHGFLPHDRVAVRREPVQEPSIYAPLVALKKVRKPSNHFTYVYGKFDVAAFEETTMPTVNGGRILASGSTYEHGRWDPSSATHANRARLRALFGHALFRWIQRYRGTRCVTSDRVPIIGQATETLWLSLGYGSSGTTSALLAAETIASGIVGELPPIDTHALAVADPSRFVERQKRRPDPFTNQSHLRTRAH